MKQQCVGIGLQAARHVLLALVCRMGGVRARGFPLCRGGSACRGFPVERDDDRQFNNSHRGWVKQHHAGMGRHARAGEATQAPRRHWRAEGRAGRLSTQAHPCPPMSASASRGLTRRMYSAISRTRARVLRPSTCGAQGRRHGARCRHCVASTCFKLGTRRLAEHSRGSAGAAANHALPARHHWRPQLPHKLQAGARQRGAQLLARGLGPHSASRRTCCKPPRTCASTLLGPCCSMSSTTPCVHAQQGRGGREGGPGPGEIGPCLALRTVGASSGRAAGWRAHCVQHGQGWRRPPAALAWAVQHSSRPAWGRPPHRRGLGHAPPCHHAHQLLRGAQAQGTSSTDGWGAEEDQCAVPAASNRAGQPTAGDVWPSMGPPCRHTPALGSVH